ncbi:MAG: pilus assembly protein PilM [Candidatus Nomurabacteria bacterium]|jgi:type IV pilus assembly protein PilM|nr:pilus assembly protein PilM [Candidatus Nomurabacteria bacterium]
MSLIKGLGAFFALDIGTRSIRVAQVSGEIRTGFRLERFGYLPIDPKMTQDTSEAGNRALGEAIKDVVNGAGIITKNIVIGLPAAKTFTTIVEVPNQPLSELKKVMKYKLDSYIPTPIGEAEVDWIPLGPLPNDPTKANVLISSTTSAFAETRMEMVEDLGFYVIGEEPDPIAICRSLAPYDATDARLIVDYGENSSDIVVYYAGGPRLVRAVPIGLKNLTKTASLSLSVKEEQARQFLLKFGLSQDKLDGRMFTAVNTTLDSFINELRKTVSFFQDNYPNVPIGGILLSGFAEVIPFMGEYIEAKLSTPTKRGNPWQRVIVPPEFQVNLAPVATEFAVCLGLAERVNDVQPVIKNPFEFIGGKK